MKKQVSQFRLRSRACPVCGRIFEHFGAGDPPQRCVGFHNEDVCNAELGPITLDVLITTIKTVEPYSE